MVPGGKLRDRVPGEGADRIRFFLYFRLLGLLLQNNTSAFKYAGGSRVLFGTTPCEVSGLTTAHAESKIHAALALGRG